MKKRWLKSLIFSVLFISLLSLITMSYYIYHQLTKPMLIADEQAIVQILPNSSATAFVSLLFNQHLIDDKTLLSKYIQYKSLATSIKAGVYEVKPQESVIQFIDRIIAGDVAKFMFKIVEGTDLRQVSSNLNLAPYLNYTEQDWQDIKGDYPSAEGLLLAETYQYDGGSAALKLLKTANKHLIDKLEHCWQTRDAGLPYLNPYQLLIAASILEKETAIASERTIISGVIVNRIKKGMPLQMDPTVIYGLGSGYQGKLKHSDMQVDSLYNTYLHKGLPPTPIAMVGAFSLEAAAHPAMTPYLYFVAKGDGTHIFSETYQQQRKAIQRSIEYKRANKP